MEIALSIALELETGNTAPPFKKINNTEGKKSAIMGIGKDEEINVLIRGWNGWMKE